MNTRPALKRLASYLEIFATFAGFWTAGSLFAWTFMGQPRSFIAGLFGMTLISAMTWMLALTTKQAAHRSE